VPGREPIKEQLQAHLPLALLQLYPLVKGGVLTQPEAIEEGTTHQGESVLEVGDQRGALRLRRERGELLGLLPGPLHHVQVQIQRSLRIQAEKLMLSEQMAVLGRSGVGEQAAQQRNGVAQSRARIVGITIRPKERG